MEGPLRILRCASAGGAESGAVSGLWYGLMLGVLFGLFLRAGGWLWMIGMSLLFGAVFGAVAGGRRDFSSLRGAEAESYDVLVVATHLTEAQRLRAGGPAQD